MYSSILRKIVNEPVECEPVEKCAKVINLARTLIDVDVYGKTPFSSAFYTTRFIRTVTPNNMRVLPKRFDYWFNFYNL